MNRCVLVLRPEPGNAATCARARAGGIEPIALPLFALVARRWTAPDPRDHDALILTSANSVRLAGTALDRLRPLPVHAVGGATGKAARAAGLHVVAIGSGDAAALIDAAARAGVRRAIFLGARESVIAPGGIITATRTVYASEETAIAPEPLVAAACGAIVLLHSPRAAARFAALFDAGGGRREGVTLAVISPAVARAAGSGWARIAVAAMPTDAALLAASD